MKKRRVKDVVHRIAYGTEEMVNALLKSSKGGKVINTAFIERLNGAFRERLATLTRKCRHAASKMETLQTGMYLIGCTYNFCIPHDELSKPTSKGGIGPCTPAMASGLTDHVWSISELMNAKIIPPPLNVNIVVTQKQLFYTSDPKKPVVRLRKGVLCSTTG